MPDSPTLLDVTSVDRLLATIRERSDISGGDEAAIYHLATHDFSQHRTLELRILATYGFGGKLYVECRNGAAVASCTAYREDEAASWFQTGRFDRLRAALAMLELEFEQPADGHGERDGGPVHLLSGEHDVCAEFDLIRCGGGITLPGYPGELVPTCMACRNARAIGGNFVALADEMSTLLGDLLTKKTFPASRREVAAKQIRLLDAAALNPRTVIAGASTDNSIRRLGVPIVAPLPELYQAFFAWNTRVLEAHGVRDMTRFPMKKIASDLLERCLCELDTANART